VGWFFQSPFQTDPNADAARRVSELAREKVYGRDIDPGVRNPFIRAGSALLTTATRGIVPYIGKYGEMEGTANIDALTGEPLGGHEGLQGYQPPSPAIQAPVPRAASPASAAPGSEFERFMELAPAQRAALVLQNPETLGTMPQEQFDRLFPQDQFVSGQRGAVNRITPQGQVEQALPPEPLIQKGVRGEVLAIDPTKKTAETIVKPELESSPEIVYQQNLQALRDAAANGDEKAATVLHAALNKDQYKALTDAKDIPSLQAVRDQYEWPTAVRTKIDESIRLEERKLKADVAAKEAKAGNTLGGAIFKSNTLQDLAFTEEEFAAQLEKYPGTRAAIEEQRALIKKGPAYAREDKAIIAQATERGERLNRLLLGADVMRALEAVGPSALGTPGGIARFASELARLSGNEKAAREIYATLSGGEKSLEEMAKVRADLTNLAFQLREQIILDRGARLSDFETKRLDTVAGTVGTGNPSELSASFSELLRLSIVASTTNDIFAGQATDFPVAVLSGNRQDYEDTKEKLVAFGFSVPDQERILRSLVAAEKAASMFGPTKPRVKGGGFQPPATAPAPAPAPAP